MEEMGNCDLPQDLVIEILLRLSVKSILRFKSVSKLWYFLFQNPNFISKYLDFRNTKNNRFLLVSRRGKINRNYFVSLLSDSQTWVDIDLPRPYKDKDGMTLGLQLLGPLNGVLCTLFNQQDIGLWNPATREFNLLPQTATNRSGRIFGHVAGFGFENNDFKVVRVFSYMLVKNITAYGQYWVCELYSVSKGCWRELPIGFPSHIYTFSRFSLYLNGVSHWLVFLSAPSIMILCFDFGHEMFRTIEIPCGELYRPLLAVLDGCIALVSNVVSEEVYRGFDIWVMMEYGVKESWTKLYKVNLPLTLISRVGFLDNELILESQNGYLVFYDIKTQEMNKFQIHGATRTLSMKIVRYTESIVSTRGGTEVEQSCNL